MKKLILFVLVLFTIQGTYSQRRMENLDRGVVAAKVTGGVYVNWRITGQEWHNVGYNLYRDGIKLNATLITGASNYVDAGGALSSIYQVAAVIDGVEQPLSKAVSVQPNPYIEFALHPIPKITGVKDSYYNEYSINDITAADLDGDGEYELIIKRRNEGYTANTTDDKTLAFENKYYTLFDAYKMDGTFLWRIDVGPNLIHNVELDVLAFDFDGDGKAELVTRLSEGSKVLDKNLNVIYEIGDEGNADGDPIPDGKTNYRDSFQSNNSWFEWKGPEYLTLLNGETAEVLDRIDHIQRKQPGYEGGNYWGPDDYKNNASALAHRSTKFHYGAPYLDGKKPSILVTRGIYYRTIMRTYDMDENKKFKLRWEWKSDTGPYCAQGNHNYSIADVDGDGCDEIVYGSMVVNNDGTGLYSTQLGHGDALHVGDFDPYRKGLEVFACLENSPYYGATYRAAEDGKILLQYIAGGDTGRCMAANVSNQYEGAEMWPSSTSSFSASEMRETSFPTGSWNFRIFWDGDLLDELLDHSMNNSLGKGIGNITKYNDATSKWETLLTSEGYYSCNHSKGTPCLQADLFGDWREEVIWRSDDDTKIRIYFTTIPTEHRIYTLMHDMQYRQAIAWQMCGYNQPPHVSYFLGEKEGITLPPPPVIDNQRLVFQSTASSWAMGSTNWKKDGENASYADNSDVLFDVSGHVSGAITLTGNVAPRTMTVNSKDDYSFDMSGGKLSGSMRLMKQGRGAFTFNGNHDYNGVTEIWDGFVNFDGQLINSPVWINLHGELAAKGSLEKGVSMNYGSVLYAGGKETIGALAIGGDLELKNNSIIEFDLANNTSQADKITLTDGKLKLMGGVPVIRINKTNGDLAIGDYVLIVANQGIDGDYSKIKVEGLGSQVGTLSYQGGNVVLTIEAVRGANTITWNGNSSGSIWNIFDQENFTLNSVNTYFVTGDAVVFDNTSSSQSINISEEVSPSSIVINSDNDYTFEGDGKIVGAASLTKSGAGKLTLAKTNDFSGPISVTGGTLSVETFPNLVSNGSIGIIDNNPDNFVINGATLTSNSTGLKVSSRALRIGENGATINTNSNFRWLAPVVGKTLTKTGNSNLAFYGANSIEKLIIDGGSVTIGNSTASAGKDIILGNNTTFTDYGGTTSNFELKDGAAARINLASSSSYTGKLTGNGSLTINIPYVRENLSGDWSAFTGTLNFVTNFVHSSWSTELRLNNTYGLAKANVNVTGKINIHHLSNSNFALGGLNGSSNSTLTMGATWTIGAMNANNTFEGFITEPKDKDGNPTRTGLLTKTGTGALTLSNANDYRGTTTVKSGYLIVANTTGSATGTGTVNVESGATLGGTGYIGGTTSVRNGGFVEAGNGSSTVITEKVGTLTFNGELKIQSGGTIKLNARNRILNPNGKIVVNGAFGIAGELVVEQLDGANFALGKELALFEFNSSVTGQFSKITLPPVADGLMWDTSELLTKGTVKVVVDPNPGVLSTETTVLQIYPNPATDFIMIDLPTTENIMMNVVDITGAVVLAREISSQEKIDVTSLPKGVYILRVNVDGKSYVSKLVKK